MKTTKCVLRPVKLDWKEENIEWTLLEPLVFMAWMKQPEKKKGKWYSYWEIISPNHRSIERLSRTPQNMGNVQEISFPTFSETIEKILKENIRAAF